MKKEVLLLDSGTQLSAEKEINRWIAENKDTVVGFIRDITISEGGGVENQKDKFRTMISGIPTPWARVMLTRKAICYKKDKSDGSTTILDGCYKLFKSEWRGLVAAYVLHPDSFEFSAPIVLNGRTVEDNAGKMSVLNMYGDMLFDEQPLWTLNNDSFSHDKNPATIQILYYKRSEGAGFKLQAVAATSPYTLFFTSVNYCLKEAVNDIPWIDSDGKFMDPTTMKERDFKIEEAQRLYSFLAQLTSAVSGPESSPRDPKKYYRDYINDLLKKVNLSEHNLNAGQIEEYIKEWSGALGDWRKELEERITGAGGKVSDNIPVSVPIPQGPLSILMNSEHTFYYNDGKFSNDYAEGRIELKSNEIFLDSEYIAAWKGVAGDELRDHSKAPVYLIPAGKKEYYLALPLTAKALSIFSAKLHDIMNVRNDIKFEASVGNEGKVTVECKAVIDATEMTIAKKTYQMEVIPESSGKVFVWPNFKSAQWHSYFFYSEFPTNVTGVRMLPHFEGVDFETATDTQIKHLVTYPVNKVDTTKHKYEILWSASPLEYVDVRLNKGGKDISAGVLCLKIQNTGDSNCLNSTGLIDKKGGLATKPSTVGIDFGSTNTCAYYKGDTGVDPVPFTNRRLAIVGFDNPKSAMAQKDELLFISNEETLAKNGQVKSWLHEHDTLYTNGVYSDEIIGGVPVNESNLPVVAMDEHIIQTNAGRLHYNMKWLSDEDGKLRKTSFIKTLWLQICADMVDKGFYPEKIHWSFPSAMSGSDRINLGNTFSFLEYPFDANTYAPVLSSYTEAESDLSYAMLNHIEVDEKRMFLGIDVGGSTSDILIVGEGESLLAQSSIRIAGGFFFKAINSSAKFRQALYNFHESKRCDIKVLNIADVIHSDPQIYNRAPYYLNNVFDQLHTPKDFGEFYRFMHMNVKQIFALPAYVTGVLLYYSGMLVKNSMTKVDSERIKEVNMMYFGKGGRLFEWLLDVYRDYAEDYLKQCFYAGYGSDNLNFIIRNDNVTSKLENKSEVAIGLVSKNIYQIADGKNSKRDIKCYDVIGEKGFTFKKTGSEERDLSDMEVIPDDIFDGGINLRFPEKMENFEKFLDIYLNFIGPDQIGIITDLSDLQAGRDNLKIRAFIQNDPEYQKLFTSKSKGTYRMPIIVAAALSYLYDTLLPAVAKQLR
ncbi:MAG: hypothetical protein ACI3ZQ_03805 [Candidatus Cryptobacteroides sp.]